MRTSGVDTGSLDSTKANGAAIDTSTVGPHTFTVTANDKAGNSRSVSVTYYVNYSWKGFLQPINLYPDPKSKFKLGSTIPVKFRIVDAAGMPVTNAQAALTLQKLSGDVPAEVPLEDFYSTSAATSGNLFRYDAAGRPLHLQPRHQGEEGRQPAARSLPGDRHVRRRGGCRDRILDRLLPAVTTRP